MLRIATRRSPLALWQSEHVRRLILKYFPEENISLIPIVTSGDKFLGSLKSAGGKGLFIKEIEEALLRDKADFAVHSMKDMPFEMMDDFTIGAILEREDPSDILISANKRPFMDLPFEATIGTSSLRRKVQILSMRSDLKIKELRGNVDTRINKLEKGEYDAITLAFAGVKRLGFLNRIDYKFTHREILPSIGQAAIGVQVLKKNKNLLNYLSPINHHISHLCVEAERAFAASIGGDCSSPIAANCSVISGALTMTALVADREGKKILRVSLSSSIDNPSELGETVGKKLIEKGAMDLLL